METNNEKKEDSEPNALKNEKEAVLQIAFAQDQKSYSAMIKCIEEVRARAGLLLGFFMLIMVDGLGHLHQLPDLWRGVCLVLILLTSGLLFMAFNGRSIPIAINTSPVFDRDWEKNKLSKVQLLNSCHKDLRTIVDACKKVLRDATNCVRVAVVCLILIVVILYLFKPTII